MHNKWRWIRNENVELHELQYLLVIICNWDWKPRRLAVSVVVPEAGVVCGRGIFLHNADQSNLDIVQNQDLILFYSPFAFKCSQSRISISFSIKPISLIRHGMWLGDPDKYLVLLSRGKHLCIVQYEGNLNTCVGKQRTRIVHWRHFLHSVVLKMREDHNSSLHQVINFFCDSIYQFV